MSLKTRALVAVLLMVGFYTLSLAVSAVLLWVPYAMWRGMDRVPLKIALGCVIAALLILWSILPRRDRFVAPGPRINKPDQPELFAEIKAIASRTSQEMPSEVYVIPEVNAWVAQRGGIMGIGSRRVMGLGLPLMGLLTVSQFRAVLAHEFGHYHAGDTKLGPWVYKTRSAIARTVQTLAEANSIVVVLFNWYAKMFLQITLAISRAQEYAADKMAAQVAGPNALIEGLKQLHRGAVAWAAYLDTEVSPAISDGFAPPLSQGFAYFVGVGVVRDQTEVHLTKELAEGKADKYDSHPALAERIAALQGFPNVDVDDSRPATTLVRNLNDLDCGLIPTAAGFSLRPVSWEQIGNEVMVSKWQKEIELQTPAFLGVKIVDLADELGQGLLWRRCKCRPSTWPTDDERKQQAIGIAGAALASALMREGWTLHAMPGEMYLDKNGKELIPFATAVKLASREITAEEWRRRCDELGITDVKMLGTAAASV